MKVKRANDSPFPARELGKKAETLIRNPNENMKQVWEKSTEKWKLFTDDGIAVAYAGFIDCGNAGYYTWFFPLDALDSLDNHCFSFVRSLRKWMLNVARNRYRKLFCYTNTELGFCGKFAKTIGFNYAGYRFKAGGVYNCFEMEKG